MGVDESVVETVFAAFLAQHPGLTATQDRFIQTSSATHRPRWSPVEQLYEAPFTNLHAEGIDGVLYEAVIDAIIALIAI